jgi:hypothetical protein
MSTINPLPNISLATPSALVPNAGATRVADGAAGAAGAAGARIERPTTPAPAAPARPLRPAMAPAPAAGGRALAADAPAGVDPQLWSVLTTEERTHFAKLSAMGPLTYGRGLSAFSVADAPPPAVRGARLDIRA